MTNFFNLSLVGVLTVFLAASLQVSPLYAADETLENPEEDQTSAETTEPNTSVPDPDPDPAPKIQPRIFKTFRVTAYCPCTLCCGKNACGIAADGKPVNGLKLVAADWRVTPKGTLLNVPGYGTRIKVRDTGKAIKGNRIDVYFDDHQTAKDWGVQYLKVEILKRK